MRGLSSMWSRFRLASLCLGSWSSAYCAHNSGRTRKWHVEIRRYRWLRGEPGGYLDCRPRSSSDRRGRVAPPHPAIWIRGWFAVVSFGTPSDNKVACLLFAIVYCARD
ncbi:uncharacterized protein B0H64DRAFT_120010 [Chaetomium fimeti]|uniref:Secreted protein n=1 Tax=Chaetomium fimeti TaxID=1854472 RepID=A0AAE0HIH9_9PEZI|nr:hypothetical protein B0H64DRAFT_120010 [Chaetomium fimeti]